MFFADFTACNPRRYKRGMQAVGRGAAFGRNAALHRRRDHRLMNRVHRWRAALDSRVDVVRHARRRWMAVVCHGLIVLLFGGACRFRAVGGAALAAGTGIALFLQLKKAAGRRPCVFEPHCWSTLLPPDRFSFPRPHHYRIRVALTLSLAYRRWRRASYSAPKRSHFPHYARHAFSERRARRGRIGTALAFASARSSGSPKRQSSATAPIQSVRRPDPHDQQAVVFPICRFACHTVRRHAAHIQWKCGVRLGQEQSAEDSSASDQARRGSRALSSAPILIYEQDVQGEARYVYYCETASERLLAVVLVERDDKIRVVTAYDLDAGQRRITGQAAARE